MPDGFANISADTQADDVTSADIKLIAQGDRRVLEVLYLELRELAMEKGLKIEYRLTLTKPPDETAP
jgi:hypothetical protein